MKKRSRGCCFLLVCLLFLLPGLYLLRDRLPGAEAFSGKREELLESITGLKEQVTGALGRQPERSEEEIAELLARGEPENGCSYYYWTLDEALRPEYMAVLDGIRSMAEDIAVSLGEEEMKDLLSMIFDDHPELFWTEQSYRYTMYENYIVIHPQYNCSAEEKEARSAVIEQTLMEALQSVPEGASPYECMKALYSFVIRDVEYDEASPDNQNIYSSMGNKVSVCTGYAKELQYLLQRMGIQALCVEGDVTDRGPHAWLIANLEGQYVHLDPTFGDPSYEEGMEEDTEPLPPELQVDYAYLCCSDATILRSRTISDKLPVPVCNSEDWAYYPMRGLYFTEYSDAVLISLQESIDRGENFWEGQFADDESYRTMLDTMQDGSFANLVLANHPEWQSVRLHLSYRDESRVVKMWY